MVLFRKYTVHLHEQSEPWLYMNKQQKEIQKDKI